jgi:peptidoglycan/LPS O-acetylase OafA/YrhL
MVVSSYRDPWLDVLRGLAVLMVVVSHLDISQLEVPITINFALNFLRPALGSGGVDLFFVLSGFLVSGLLFREWDSCGKIRIGRFLIRRGFKIYPAFWAALSFIVAVRLWRGYGVPLDRLAGELLFLQNYLGRLSDPHWTLAVEEHFYLLLAALFVWHSHSKRPRVAEGGWVTISFVAMALGCLLWRFSAYVIWPNSTELVLMVSHARMDGLFAGVLLTWGCRNRAWHSRLQSHLSLISCLAIALLLWLLFAAALSLNYNWGVYAGPNITAAAAALLLLAGVGRRQNLNQPWWIALSAVGKHSYSIYLWHSPWLRFMQPFVSKYVPGSDLWWVSSALGIGGSLALGRLMGEIVEKPCLRLRDYWFPSVHMTSQK